MIKAAAEANFHDRFTPENQTNLCQEIILDESKPCTLSAEETAVKFKFETKQLVNDKDVTTMSEDELIDAIAGAEAEVAKLKGIQAESKHIKKRIKELNKFIASVVTVLDAK